MANVYDNLQSLEEKLGHTFKDKNLLKMAITHSSVRGSGKHFERLEFLGDRVLELVVSENLYKQFTAEKEGDLAKRLAALVCRSTCEQVAGYLNLAEYIKVNGADLGPRSAILGDAMEALIGAIYLDGQLPACKKFINKMWFGETMQNIEPPKDSKTSLQEWAQINKKPIPVYKLLETTGPDHAPTFHVEVQVAGRQTVMGEGNTKRAAEQDAARKFLSTIKR